MCQSSLFLLLPSSYLAPIYSATLLFKGSLLFNLFPYCILSNIYKDQGGRLALHTLAFDKNTHSNNPT